MSFLFCSIPAAEIPQNPQKSEYIKQTPRSQSACSCNGSCCSSSRPQSKPEPHQEIFLSSAMSSIKRSHLPPQQRDQGFPSLTVAVAYQQAQKLRPDPSEATAAKPRSQQQEACCSGLSLKAIREHPEMVRSLKMLLLCILSLALVLTISTELTQRMGGVPDILNQTLNFTRQRIHSELADAINGGSSSSGHGGELQQRPTPGVFNRTLLHYAAVQLGEEEEKRKIAGLLETAAFGGRNYRRVAEHDTYLISRRHARSVPLQLFHPRFAPFWSEFRRSLRAWVFNKRYNPRVMAELSALVKDPLDRHYNFSGIVKNLSSSGRYGSCAVVGNSGILVAGSHGQLIDSHDIVIRLNNARILGFAASVGSKTSLAFVNSNILHLCSRRARCYCHPYGEQVPIIMYICQAVHFMDYAFCNASHKAPLLITDARFDNLCARIVKYYSLKNFVEKTGKGPEEWSSAHEGAMFHYSSGMQAVMLALGICDQVSLFGFGKSPNAKHHYHTNQKAELPLHDYEAEYQLYHDLANRSPNIPFLGDSGIDLPPLKIYV